MRCGGGQPRKQVRPAIVVILPNLAGPIMPGLSHAIARSLGVITRRACCCCIRLAFGHGILAR
jgi:hypothetical protein